jgi:hypothetical protein
MIVGLASALPSSLGHGLVAQGVSPAEAHRVAGLPPISTLFAAFLGYNPMHTLLGDKVLAALPPDKAAYLTGKTFFPQLISSPFKHGLVIVFTVSLLMCLIAAAASWLRGGHYVHTEDDSPGGGEGVGGVGPFGAPAAESADPDASPHPEEWIPA